MVARPLHFSAYSFLHMQLLVRDGEVCSRDLHARIVSTLLSCSTVQDKVSPGRLSCAVHMRPCLPAAHSEKLLIAPAASAVYLSKLACRESV